MEFAGPIEAISAMETVFAAAQKYLTEEIWRAGDTEVAECLRRSFRLSGQVQSVSMGLVHETEVRGTPEAVGAVSTAAYVRSALLLSPREAKTTANMAEALAETRAATGTALAVGQVNWEQARAIVEVVQGLSRIADLDQQAKSEALLIDRASELNADGLRGYGKLLEYYLDPDGLEPREKKAKAKRGAHIVRNPDGTQSLRWCDTDENMALLKAALEPLAGPRPGPDGERDPRDPALRRADALVDLVSMGLRHGDLPTSRGARPHLVLTLGSEPLAITASGEHLSDEAVRRICCDAVLTAIRLDANGVPLSIGRTRRLVTPSQWLALVARDKGCIFPGCDRPSQWTQAHHRIHWSAGGPTDLENLVLLCDHHHDVIHHESWQVEFGQDGHPEVIPPPWADPERRPRRNHHWQPLRPSVV